MFDTIMIGRLMLKVYLKIYMLLLIVGLFVSFGGRLSAAEGTTTVTVVGSSWLNGLTTEAALILAKSEAKRRALERAGKNYISSSTETRNMLLVSDVVMTRSIGVLTNVKWGESWIKDGKIFVEMTADILTENFNADFMAIEKTLREVGMPRVGILICAEIGGTGNTELPNVKPYTFFREAFLGGLQLYFMKITPEMDIKYLSEDRKYDGGNLARLFNASARDKAGESSRLEIELKSGAENDSELKAIIAAGNEYGVDIIVVGNLRIVVEKRKLSGVDTVSYTFAPHVEVIQTSNNKTLAVIEESFTTEPLPVQGEHNEIMKSIKRIGLRIGRALMGQMLVHWSNNSYSMHIVLKEADYEKVGKLESALSKAGGEQRFVLRSMSSGIAHIDFYSDMTRDELQKYLSEQAEVDVDIESILEGETIIKLDDGWF